MDKPDAIEKVYGPRVHIDVTARATRLAKLKQAATERAEARAIQRQQEFESAICGGCGKSIHEDPQTGEPYQGAHGMAYEGERGARTMRYWHGECGTPSVWRPRE